MTMNIDNIFSEKDPLILSDASRDGLGIQMIWSYYGQAVFNNKLNSIATDIRNFSLNLFNHRLIKHLVENELNAESLIGPGRYHSLLDLKSGLIIFLETLFVYSMHAQARNEGNTDADMGGVLGSNAVNAKWADYKGNPPLSIDKKKDEILKRQLSLGVNGRYKTPFKQMYLFDDAYNYALSAHPAENRQAWKDVERFFPDPSGMMAGKDQEWAAAIKNLHDALSRLIVDLLEKDKRTIRFNDLTVKRYERIPFLWAECFGRQAAIPKSLKKDFWKSRLGLNCGAPAALYYALNQCSGENNEEVVVQEAIEHCDDTNERKKLERIFHVEPFLALMDTSFNLLCDAQTTDLARASALVNKAYRLYSSRISPDLRDLQGIAPPENEAPEACRRFKDLVEVYDAMQNERFTKAVDLLIQYHKNIIKSRGGMMPWVDIDGTRLEHRGRIVRNVQHDEPKWVNDYYLSTLRNIFSGIEEKQ